MNSHFTVRTADQLPTLLQAFRKDAGLTQSEVALRLGVAQQTYSAMERNADTVGAARLLKLLNILGVELVLGKSAANPAPAKDSGQTPPASDQPSW
ncbi:MAG: helix-turn-helix domain-containing protein [Casimicrobiaceae bacterium]